MIYFNNPAFQYDDFNQPVAKGLSPKSLNGVVNALANCVGHSRGTLKKLEKCSAVLNC